MTTMQKNHLKKVLKVFGALAYGIIAITFIAAGEPWHWITLAMTGLVALPIAVAMVYLPIAGAVWHWRLMGICEEEWQSNLLSCWWFWISRSENWFDYLKKEIESDFGDDEKAKRQAIDFLYALARVKKPRWL